MKGSQKARKTGGLALSVLLALSITLPAVIMLLSSTAPLAGAFSGSGSGTAGDPYIITTVEQLQEINGNLTARYSLYSNIDASATKGWNGGAGFEPIGSDTHPFAGVFDGRGHTIYNMCINRYMMYVGLFGYVGSGVVKYVGLDNASVSGSIYVGSLAGYSGGTISLSYARGSVAGVSYVGGLLGGNSGAVSGCYSACSVSYSLWGGGLVGHAEGSGWEGVSNSFWDEGVGGWGTGPGTGKTTENMKNVRTYTDTAWSSGLASPWDFAGNPYSDTGNRDFWGIDPSTNGDYPFMTGAPTNVPPNKPTNIQPTGRVVGATQTLSALVADGDGDRTSVFFYNNSDGSLIGSEEVESGQTTEVAWYGLIRGAACSFYVKAQDICGAWSEPSYVQTFQINQPPTTPSTTLSTETVFVRSGLVASADSSDPDGDTISYYFKFYNATDSIIRRDWGSTGTYTIGVTDAHDNIVVYAKAHDGYEYSEEQWRSTLVANTPPSVDNLVVGGLATPSALGAPAPTFGWTFSDSDGDSQAKVQIRVGTTEGENDMWDSTAATGVTSTTYSGSAMAGSVTYYVGIRAYDGYGWSDWADVSFVPAAAPTSYDAVIVAFAVGLALTLGGYLFIYRQGKQ